MARFLSDRNYTFKVDENPKPRRERQCGCQQFIDPYSWESESGHYDTFWKKCTLHGGPRPCLLTREFLPSLECQMANSEAKTADFKRQIEYCKADTLAVETKELEGLEKASPKLSLP